VETRLTKGRSLLDPFAGSGSTGLAAEQLCRNVTLIDNKPEYVEVIKKRLEASKVKNRERVFVVPPELPPIESEEAKRELQMALVLRDQQNLYKT